MTPSGWIRLYRSLLEDPVWTTSTPEQRSVLVAILLTVNHEPRQWLWQGRKFDLQPGQMVTSLSSLAKAAGVSVQSVRSALARFEKLNFSTYESTKTGRLITVVKWHTYQGLEHEGNKEVNKDPTKTQQLTRIKECKKENPLIGFSDFWSAYPRKVGRQPASREWTKIKPDAAMVETIISALDIHKRSDQWQRDDGRFIPHPATWLRQRRWEDDVETAEEIDDVPEHSAAAEAIAREFGL